MHCWPSVGRNHKLSCEHGLLALCWRSLDCGWHSYKVDKNSMRGGIDRLLLMAVLLLVGFGVAMVFDASVADATRTFNDKFFFVKRQLVWITLGLLSMTITSFVNYKFWEKISVPLFGATILLLIVVLIPGIGVSALGASRRIGVGFLGVQPAEIAKLSLVIGQSRQKYLYLPEPATDSIFAIIAEELGFIGATILILAFLFVFLRGFKIALSAEDSFGRLLATGITSWLAIQTLINLSAMVALVPLTGVPLPLVSYGGSSLLVTLTAIGILLNISKHRTTINRQ